MDKAQVQPLAIHSGSACMVGLGSGSGGWGGDKGHGQKGRAEDRGKEKDDDLIGKIKGGAITTSSFGSLFAGLKPPFWQLLVLC
jgi:hypothetical protein